MYGGGILLHPSIAERKKVESQHVGQIEIPYRVFNISEEAKRRS